MDLEPDPATVRTAAVGLRHFFTIHVGHDVVADATHFKIGPLLRVNPLMKGATHIIDGSVGVLLVCSVLRKLDFEAVEGRAGNSRMTRVANQNTAVERLGPGLEL